MQVSSKVEFDLIHPLLKNQQLTGSATQKSVRTIDAYDSETEQNKKHRTAELTWGETATKPV